MYIFRQALDSSRLISSQFNGIHSAATISDDWSYISIGIIFKLISISYSEACGLLRTYPKSFIEIFRKLIHFWHEIKYLHWVIHLNEHHVNSPHFLVRDWENLSKSYGLQHFYECEGWWDIHKQNVNNEKFSLWELFQTRTKSICFNCPSGIFLSLLWSQSFIFVPNHSKIPILRPRAKQ